MDGWMVMDEWSWMGCAAGQKDREQSQDSKTGPTKRSKRTGLTKLLRPNKVTPRGRVPHVGWAESQGEGWVVATVSGVTKIGTRACHVTAERDAAWSCLGQKRDERKRLEGDQEDTCLSLVGRRQTDSQRAQTRG